MLTDKEKDELKRLENLQMLNTRWLSQEEFDRISDLRFKKLRTQEMSLDQAKYIQRLTLGENSLRATAGHFYAKYNEDLTLRIKENPYSGYGGNQLAGIFLREEAIKVLKKHNIIPGFDIYGIDETNKS